MSRAGMITAEEFRALSPWVQRTVLYYLHSILGATCQCSTVLCPDQPPQITVCDAHKLLAELERGPGGEEK